MERASGGPAQGIRNLAGSLAPLGNHIEVVCLDDTIYDKKADTNLLIHSVGHGLSTWSFNEALKSWLELNLQRFDAIILNGIWLYPTLALWLTVNKLKKQGVTVPPYFVMPHGMLDPWFQKAPTRKFKAARNWIYWKLIEHRIVRDASAVLFTCEVELNLARTTFKPYKPKAEINVGYGIVEPPAFQPNMRSAFTTHCAELGKQSYLLYLSRIDPKKGVDLLIQAYSDAAKDRYAANNPLNDDQKVDFPALVIAGPGMETTYGREMQALANALTKNRSANKLKESSVKILFTGMLTGDTKWGAIYGCSAFILPSHQENFGIAVVEALACGKPVLISNQINIWKEIETDGAAIVADDTELGTLTLLQKWLDTSDAERQVLSANARSCYLKRFEAIGAASKLLTTLKSTELFKEAIFAK